MSCSCRWAYGFFSAFCRSLRATRMPMWSGAFDRRDVAADVRGEVAAGARVQRRGERHGQRQRPHRLALGLLLEGDGEHPLVDAGLDQLAGHDRGRAADRAGGVHPEQRLADRAQRVGQVQLGHHHALEEVGRLADDDGVDVGPGHLGVGEGPRRPPRGRARPWRRRRGSPGAWSGRRRRRQLVPLPSSALPFQDAHEVLLEAGPRGGVGDASGGLAIHDPCATSPMRIRPATITGLAASAPPEGFTLTCRRGPARRAGSAPAG